MRVERLGRDGQGRLADGTAVPRSLPGEEVEPRGDGTWRILRPSPDRVTPPCPHFAACGACALQHASDPFVTAWKADVVRRALAAQGLAAEMGPVLTSPARSRRRARLAGRRLRRGGVAGFHARGSDTLVEVPRCQILRPSLVALLPALAGLAGLASSRKGEVALAVTETEAGADVGLEGGVPLTPALRSEAAAWAAQAGVARLAWGAEPVAQAAPPVLRMGPARVEPPPGAFLQATREGEAALVAAVLAAVEGAGRVADLFAGLGTFALPLSKGAEVRAVESEAAALAALDRAWRATPGLRALAAERRDLFRRPLLAEELRPFEAVVIDPPRAGAEAQAREIAASGVPVVAWVSCDPRTFARDARLLAERGYAMGPVTVVDQFRWSPHVETVTRFSRR